MRVFLNISQISQENTCVGVFFFLLMLQEKALKTDSNKAVLSEICEIFKNSFFEKHLKTNALARC